MPNYCDFKMLIKGKKENVETLVDYLKADYDYRDGKSHCTADHHFFRVFRAEEDEADISELNGVYKTVVEGYCAWSVYTCMFDGPHTYFRDMTPEELEVPADEIKATHLLKCSGDLDLTIEVIAIEEDCHYEHYIIESGVLTLNERYRVARDENGDMIYDEEFAL